MCVNKELHIDASRHRVTCIGSEVRLTRWRALHFTVLLSVHSVWYSVVLFFVCSAFVLAEPIFPFVLSSTLSLPLLSVYGL